MLNIRLTPKIAEGNTSEEKKITKLAIGKPGGIDADTDKFDTHASVICKLCNAQLPTEEPDVASIVDSILLAQSAYNANSISEWEQELKTCQHTENLD